MTHFTSFDEIKKAYEDFKLNPPEDEYKRYLGEFKYLKELSALSSKMSLIEAQYYKKAFDEILILLKRKGYKVKL